MIKPGGVGRDLPAAIRDREDKPDEEEEPDASNEGDKQSAIKPEW